MTDKVEQIIETVLRHLEIKLDHGSYISKMEIITDIDDYAKLKQELNEIIEYDEDDCDECSEDW